MVRLTLKIFNSAELYQLIARSSIVLVSIIFLFVFRGNGDTPS